MTSTTPYEDVLDIAIEFFGPATHRVIDRLIVNHLHKSPRHLQPKDLPQLIRWIKLTISMLTDDGDLIDDCTRRLDELRAQGF